MTSTDQQRPPTYPPSYPPAAPPAHTRAASVPAVTQPPRARRRRARRVVRAVIVGGLASALVSGVAIHHGAIAEAVQSLVSWSDAATATGCTDPAGLLVLVNRDHPADGEPRDLVAASPMVPVMLDGISLRPTALDAVAGLFAAARAEGVGPFTVSSGFRSAASQQQLWDEGPQRFGDQWRDYVLPPGHSEHQTGLAADIMATGIPKADLGASPEGRWLAANAPRFGLILRYPEGKQPITGVAAEPWHFRFVGQAHATAMTGQGLVLEEYLTQACPSGGSA